MVRYTAERLIDKGCSIYIFKSAYKHKLEKLHTHDFTEIVFSTGGSVTHCVDGKRYSLRRGDMLVIAPESEHSYNAENSFSYVNICFCAPLPRNITPGKTSFFGADVKEIETLLRYMLSEGRDKKRGWEDISRGYLDIIFMKLRRIQSCDGGNAASYAKCREISKYIDEHLSEHITLSSLAEKMFYNPSYMSRFFKEKFGEGFSEYLIKRRIEAAKELLLRDEAPISEIAKAIGFETRSSFYAAFSKYMRCTPKEYRERKQKEP